MPASELLLHRDPSSRYVPWIIAALSLVVAISLGAAFALAAVTEHWGTTAAGQVTLRMASDEPGRVDAVLREVAAIDAVERVEHLPPADVARLLSPWLGKAASADPELLPLPHLFDVRLRPGANAALAERALDRIGGITVDRADAWLQPLEHLAGLARLVAYALAAVALGAIVLVTVFATRSALVNQHRTVELLRLIGAEDRYVARHFQRHGLRLALTGGVAGTVPGLAVTFFAVAAARLDGAELLAGLTPSAIGWVAIAAIPLLVAIVATLTARLTVIQMLGLRW